MFIYHAFGTISRCPVCPQPEYHHHLKKIIENFSKIVVTKFRHFLTQSPVDLVASFRVILSVVVDLAVELTIFGSLNRERMTSVAGPQHSLLDHLVGCHLQVGRPSEPCEEIDERQCHIVAVQRQLRYFVVPWKDVMKVVPA
jgi:hypothetical protein